MVQKIGQLSRLQRILISALTVIVIIGLFVYFFYMPKLQEIDDLKTGIKKSERRLKETKQKAAELEEYRKKMEMAQAKFRIVSRALPLKDEVPSLLTSVSQAGKDSGLTFLLFEPRAEERKDFYAEIPINMQLAGGYHDLGEFFDKLARMPRIVNVERFQLDLENQSSADLTIDCTAETYKFVESAMNEESGGKKKNKRRK
jgi:type IV pilus assembly protein PilO